MLYAMTLELTFVTCGWIKPGVEGGYREIAVGVLTFSMLLTDFRRCSVCQE